MACVEAGLNCKHYVALVIAHNGQGMWSPY